MKKKIPTVAELIEVLKQLPPNAPVYIRSKYSGEVSPFTDYPLNIDGVSEMEFKGKKVTRKYVCFLY